MRASAEEKKDAVLAELSEARRHILEAAAALPLEAQDVPFLGVWSVKDLLAHLAGWDETNLAAAKAILAGRLPDFYSHHDRDWRTYNATLVAEYRREDLHEQLTLARATQQRLSQFLKALPAAEFDRDYAVRYKDYKVTIARLLEAETKDEWVHHAQLDSFIRQSSS